VAENEPQHAKLVRPAERGGYGLDALWNDDFHHGAMVALTGHHEAYYSDHRGRPGEFVAAPNTASSIRASATNGSGKRAVRRPSIFRRNVLLSFCRTTTRSPIPVLGNAVTG
jgi:hypothetical protein